MRHAFAYPLFLDLAHWPVLVVGGGAVALRKVKGLMDSEARVTVVSPEFAAGFEELETIERIQSPYAASHMAQRAWRLVFATTNVREVNERVGEDAKSAHILCCRSDEPDEGDFSSGASVRLEATADSANNPGLMLAVSTAGASPALAARICREAAVGIDPILPLFAYLLRESRARCKKELTSPQRRRALLQRLAGPEMEILLRRDGADEAQRVFQEWLAAAQAESHSPAAGISPAISPPDSSRATKHAQ